MNTLKRLISSIVFFATAFVTTAQDYNNIEFIENKGQWDNSVKYMGEVNAGAIFIRSTGFTILQHNPDDYLALQSVMHEGGNINTAPSLRKADGKISIRSHAIAVDFLGASPQMKVVPDKVIDTYNNYFIGNDPSKWVSNCRIYQAITLKDVYPNVDVRYYTNNGTLKYDIIAKPGADISKIAIKYDGASKLAVKNKELIVGTSIGDLKESFPYTYQTGPGRASSKWEVKCKYVVKDNIVRFDVKDYDKSSTLVIDPFFRWCSLSGSGANNWGFTATYGPDGAFYGGGIIFAGTGFPVSTGAFQTTYQGGVDPLPVDIGIIKLSANGANRVYGTYIGGSGTEQPHSLIVDGQGNLIIAGRTNSPLTTDNGGKPYPITAGGVVGNCGSFDIIVTELNPTGSGLIGSKRIGGTGNDGVNIKDGRGGTSSLEQNYGDDGRSEVILDGGGNIYIASCSQSGGTPATGLFPVTAGAYQQTFGGKQDAVVLKLAPNVGPLIFATFIGGSENDAGYVLSLGQNGDIYVGGGTESSNFVSAAASAGTIGPAYNTNIDGFVARLSNDGSTLIKATYLGTNNIDQVYGLKFDRNGFPYVTGQTRGNWPIQNAAYSSGGRQFIAKLQPDLSAYVYSTVFGNGSADPNISPTAFLVDRCENVYVSGWGGRVSETNPNQYASAGTANLPLTADALPYPPGGPDGRDFYFFVLKKDAVSQLFGSYFGQNGGFTDHVDGGTSRFDQNGVIYQAICANCGGGATFPTSPGVFARVKPATASCNLGMVKIAFDLAGVGSDVGAAINGVPMDTAGCVPLDVVFTDEVRNAKQYIWNFGDGTGDFGPMDADTGYTRTHTFNSVGTFLVTLVAIDPASCNVRDTSYINIRVGNLEALLNASYHKVGVCTELGYQFDNLTPDLPARPFTDTSFIWDFGDGSPRVIAGLNSVTHIFPAPGPYNVKLILNDSGYCNFPDSILLPINVAANVQASFTIPATGCAPYTASFENTSIGGATWEWDFGDPASGANNTSTLSNPSHFYAVPGTYTIVLVANDPNTCNRTDTTRTTIIVYDKPTANFTYSPTSPIVNTPNIFSNQSSANAVRWIWKFGDGDTLLTTSRADVTHQYNSTGTFDACLIAFNQVGCSDTFCLPVQAIIEPLLDVPNAFTPNTGDINSVIMVRGFGIAKIRWTIWNRWGQKVFETNSRSQGWDGRVKGVVQPMDVYVYTLDVEFFDGTKTTKKGDITLIR